jgi:hypothetical protein
MKNLANSTLPVIRGCWDKTSLKDYHEALDDYRRWAEQLLEDSRFAEDIDGDIASLLTTVPGDSTSASTVGDTLDEDTVSAIELSLNIISSLRQNLL